jgi:hypothetical protein
LYQKASTIKINIYYYVYCIIVLFIIFHIKMSTSSCNNKKGIFVSGTTQEFITIYIVAHGTALPLQKTPSWLKNNVYKLSLGGVNGNVSTESRVLHTLLFNSARRLGSNRVKQPIQKLDDVREEVFRYFNIKDEITVQQLSQHRFVMHEKSYQKCASIDCWLPKPFAVAHNHMYEFGANPWARPTDAHDGEVKIYSTHTEILERQKFGIWVVDASMRIAKKIGLLPGIQPNVVSLMQLLGVLPTTMRSPHDTDNATVTTLFHIVYAIQRIFGHNVSVCVIDISCRYTKWEEMRASQFKHGFGRTLGRVSQFMKPYLPKSFHQTMRRTSLSLLDSRPPRPASPMAIQVSDWIVWNDHNDMGQLVQKQNRITFWNRNGKIRCDDVHDPTMALGLPFKPDGSATSYRIGDKIKLDNDRTFTIFHIMQGSPTWFFTHTDPEPVEVEDTGTVNEEDVNEDDEFEDIDEDETKTLYFAVIDDNWYITPRPVAPKYEFDIGYSPAAVHMPAPLLPPDEYDTIIVPPMRTAHGGGTIRKQSRHNRRRTIKKRT